MSKTIINSTLFTSNLAAIKYGQLTKSTKKIKFLKSFLNLVNDKINSPNGERSGEEFYLLIIYRHNC